MMSKLQGLPDSLKQWLPYYSGAILFYCGTFEIMGWNSNAQLANSKDPVLLIHFNVLILVLGLIQSLLALILIFSRWKLAALYIANWLGLTLLLFNVSALCLGWHHLIGYVV